MDDSVRSSERAASGDSTIVRLIAAARDGVLGFDGEGRCLYANEAAQRILSIPAAQMIGRHVHAFHGDSARHSERDCPLYAAIAGAAPANGTDRFDASPAGIAVAYSLFPAAEEASNHGAILRFWDDTQRRSKDDLTFYTQLLEAVEQAVVATDRFGHVTYWNAGAERLYAVPKSLALGQNVLHLIHSSELDARSDEIAQRLLSGNAWIGELTIDSPSLPTMNTILAIRDDDGRVVGFVGVAKDIGEKKRAERELREANERLVRAFERISDGAFTVYPGWKTTPNAHQMAILDQSVQAGKNLWEEYPSLLGTEFEARCQRAMSFQETEEFEVLYEPTGTWLEIHAYPFSGGLTVYFRDITERKNFEAELLESNERFRLLALATRDLISDWDVKSNRVWRNDFLEAQFGYERSKIESTPEWWFRRIHDEQRDTVLTSIREFIESDRDSWSGEYRVRRGDGRYANVLSRAYALRNERKEAVRVIIATTDLTRIKEAEQELADSRKALRALSRRLLVVQESERKRIAQGIHDQLGQSLTALKFFARAIEQQPKTAESRAREMSEVIDETIDSVRRIAGELRPRVLDDLGLPAAIDREVREFTRLTGIQCRLLLLPGIPPPDAEQAITIFRILQESLTNIARHAEATRVRVTFGKSAHGLRLRVRDDGKGISSAAPEPASLGIVGMRERALLLGGSLRIENARGGGTAVDLVIPCVALGVGKERSE